MRRLVAVSNRVHFPKSGNPPGGLGVGVMSVLKEHGGVWFGWSGKTTETKSQAPISRVVDDIEFVTVDLHKQDHEGYYAGFSNSTLWPLLHFMLSYFSYSREQYEAYRRTNEIFARGLLQILQPYDLIWVHDYHLFPLGEALRRLGCKQPIGFFLHVPFPGFQVLRTLPCYEDILRALACYDLVGFQTDTDLSSFKECLTQPEIGGEVLGDDRLLAFGHNFKAGVFPIGIDVDECQAVAQANRKNQHVKRLADSLNERKLVLGVDRLDYSKGIELRFRSIECLLEQHPEMRGRVVFMQIAPPTRSGVRTYDVIRQGLERAAGNINGRFAETDWVPIRYINRAYGRESLMAMLRLAAVGLITPVRDGMNLVAKEYIASQDPDDPGTPVVSTLCGAAQELTDAILVNPYDHWGVAEGLQRALEMPLEERRERHAAMIAVLRRNDVHRWSRRFVNVLHSMRAEAVRAGSLSVG
jgi:trehalose 6-phosphate synthase